MRAVSRSLLLLLPALAACTPMEWVKPDATPGQLQADASQCQRDAWYEARSRHWYYRPFAPMAFQDAAGRPLFGWPYGPSDPFGDPYLEEGRLAQFCMRSKGYQLVPSDSLRH